MGNYGNPGPQFGAAGTGIVPRLPPSSHDFMSPSGTKLEMSIVKKRRTSSSSGPSLDDEGKTWFSPLVVLRESEPSLKPTNPRITPVPFWGGKDPGWEGVHVYTCTCANTNVREVCII